MFEMSRDRCLRGQPLPTELVDKDLASSPCGGRGHCGVNPM